MVLVKPRVDNIAWGRESELVDELAPHTSSAGAIEVVGNFTSRLGILCWFTPDLSNARENA